MLIGASMHNCGRAGWVKAVEVYRDVIHGPGVRREGARDKKHGVVRELREAIFEWSGRESDDVVTQGGSIIETHEG